MKKMKDLKTMKSNTAKELNRIPDFIQSTSILHHGVWNNMTLCNNLIFSLISARVFTRITIEKIVQKFDQYIDEMISILTPAEQLHLAAYYANVFDYIMEEAEEIEAYETCANIVQFDDIYNGTRKDDNE